MQPASKLRKPGVHWDERLVLAIWLLDQPAQPFKSKHRKAARIHPLLPQLFSRSASLLGNKRVMLLPSAIAWALPQALLRALSCALKTQPRVTSTPGAFC